MICSRDQRRKIAIKTTATLRSELLMSIATLLALLIQLEIATPSAKKRKTGPSVLSDFRLSEVQGFDSNEQFSLGNQKIKSYNHHTER